MDEDFVRNLFNKFTQEDESITRKFGGTGLGMNISRDLVDLMGGTIEAKSVKGQGTTISILLNCKKGNEDHIQEKDIIEIDEQIFKNKRFLVTDDNEMNRLVACTILNSYGGITIEAVDGQDAIDKISNNEFDLVLMDVQMPIMNGLDATRYIRKNISKDLPIIALTAFALKGDKERFIDAGMNDYLFPFDQLKVLYYGQVRYLDVSGRSVSKSENLVAVTEESEVLYDLTLVKSLAGKNISYINQICKIFIRQAEEVTQNIRLALDANDFKRVRDLAHNIKPSIDQMGIKSLTVQIIEISSTEWDLTSKNELIELVNYVEDVFEKVCKQLSEI